MSSALIFFITFAVLLVLSGFLIVVIYFYRRLIKKGYKATLLIISFIIVSLISFEIYIAIYPLDSFYLEEFKEVTLRSAPKTSEVINKSTSYPDFHGDYISVSLIQLSYQDYYKLFKELLEDQRLIKNGELIGSEEFNKVMGNLDTKQIKFNFIRPIKGEEYRYLYIGFLDDQKTIIVYVCVT